MPTHPISILMKLQFAFRQSKQPRRKSEKLEFEVQCPRLAVGQKHLFLKTYVFIHVPLLHGATVWKEFCILSFSRNIDFTFQIGLSKKPQYRSQKMLVCCCSKKSCNSDVAISFVFLEHCFILNWSAVSGENLMVHRSQNLLVPLTCF